MRVFAIELTLRGNIRRVRRSAFLNTRPSTQNARTQTTQLSFKNAPRSMPRTERRFNVSARDAMVRINMTQLSASRRAVLANSNVKIFDRSIDQSTGERGPLRVEGRIADGAGAARCGGGGGRRCGHGAGFDGLAAGRMRVCTKATRRCLA